MVKKPLVIALVVGAMAAGVWSVLPQHVQAGNCTLSSGSQSLAGRNVILAVPKDVSNAPLILEFHGGHQSNTQQAAYSGLGAAGAARGYVVATPQGSPGTPGNVWYFAGSQMNSDVAFANSLISALSQAGCVDANRVYTTGISDGADMANTLACQLASVKAVASVAPSVYPVPCNKRASYLEIHGDADPIVAYNGDASPRSDVPSLGVVNAQPVTSRIAQWAAGCAPAANTALPERHLQRWNCGSRVVELDTVLGGGHTWPGGNRDSEPAATLGNTASFSANDVILNFFAQH